MPISVTCPECNSTYRVGDEAAGKAIKCKKCGARVPVPAGDEEEAPAGAGGANGDEGSAGKAKKKSNTTLIVALVGVLVLLCCICVPGGSFATWWFGFRTVGPQVEIKGPKDAMIKDNPFKDIEKAFKDNPFKDATKK